MEEDTRRRPNRAGLPSSLQLRRDRSVFAATSPRQDAAASKDKWEKMENEKLRRWDADAPVDSERIEVEMVRG
jgi:hypothetical protein